MAQEARGLWTKNVPQEKQNPIWKAQWIWLDEAEDANVILARKCFNASDKEEEAILYITASSIYRLYINGHLIAHGPARSAPHHQFVDAWEISSFLQEGENCLAVRVHSQENKHSYHREGRAGLFVQLEMGNRLIISDDQWNVTVDEAWNASSPTISRFQQVVVDQVDFRKYEHHWYQSNFDDSKWKKAVPLMRNVGWPSPQKDAKAIPLTPPWTSLLLRDLPYLVMKKQKAEQLIQAGSIELDSLQKGLTLDRIVDQQLDKPLADYKENNKAIEIPPIQNEKPYLLLFDLDSLINGYPQMEISGPEGTEISILYAPFLVDEVFSYQVVFSNFEDKIILSGQKDIWEATYFKPIRYMGILLPSSTKPITIHHAGLRSIAYPFKRIGTISSTDAPWISDYMDATENTIKACTTDGYTDNYRERRQYAQTGYYGAMGNYWLFGDHELQRRYLIQVSHEQHANGIMPAYAPLAADDYMIILDSNCLWIRSLRNYLLYSGDYETVRQLLPSSKKLMELLHSFTDTLGMINNPPYPYWLDHAHIDRRGSNFTLNGHYLGALEDFIDILHWLEEKEVSQFQKRASQLRSSLSKHFWDTEKGLFADAYIEGKRSERFSEHSQAMALSLNIGTQTQRDQVARTILEADELNYVDRASGMTMVTPAMSYFLHKGLCENGYINESMDLFRKRFDKMLSPETNQNLWEEWWLDATGRSGKKRPTSRSDAQTESCFPPALFGEYLLGISATSPAWKKVEMIAHPVLPKHLKANIPTPEGVLSIRWEKSLDGSGKLELDIPGEMVMSLNLKSFEALSMNPISIDDKVVKESKSFDYSTLSKGKHTISF